MMLELDSEIEVYLKLENQSVPFGTFGPFGQGSPCDQCDSLIQVVQVVRLEGLCFKLTFTIFQVRKCCNEGQQLTSLGKLDGSGISLLTSLECETASRLFFLL